MGPTAAGPDAFVAALTGWQRPLVQMLRTAIHAAAPFEEVIKWTNLVFLSNGPCILIRAEEARILLGFWRGKRLLPLAPALKSSGKYELANWIMEQATDIEPPHITQLARHAAALNAQYGDPTKRT